MSVASGGGGGSVGAKGAGPAEAVRRWPSRSGVACHGMQLVFGCSSLICWSFQCCYAASRGRLPAMQLLCAIGRLTLGRKTHLLRVAAVGARLHLQRRLRRRGLPRGRRSGWAVPDRRRCARRRRWRGLPHTNHVHVLHVHPNPQLHTDARIWSCHLITREGPKGCGRIQRADLRQQPQLLLQPWRQHHAVQAGGAQRPLIRPRQRWRRLRGVGTCAREMVCSCSV
jgi:hypothetical protein